MTQDGHIFILSQWINAVNRTVMIRILQIIQIDFQIKPRRSLQQLERNRTTFLHKTSTLEKNAYAHTSSIDFYYLLKQGNNLSITLILLEIVH